MYGSNYSTSYYGLLLVLKSLWEKENWMKFGLNLTLCHIQVLQWLGLIQMYLFWKFRRLYCKLNKEATSNHLTISILISYFQITIYNRIIRILSNRIFLLVTIVETKLRISLSKIIVLIARPDYNNSFFGIQRLQQDN